MSACVTIAVYPHILLAFMPLPLGSPGHPQIPPLRVGMTTWFPRPDVSPA